MITGFVTFICHKSLHWLPRHIPFRLPSQCRHLYWSNDRVIEFIELSSDPNVRRDDGLKECGPNFHLHTRIESIWNYWYKASTVFFPYSYPVRVLTSYDSELCCRRFGHSNTQRTETLPVSEIVAKIYLSSIPTPFFEAHPSPTMQYSASLPCQKPPRLPSVFCHYISLPSIRSIVKDKQRPA